MIAILDYDMGNIKSIKNILHKIGEDNVVISNNRKDIDESDGIILPGVGAYDTGMINLKKYDLVDLIIDKAVNKKTPILGICLGMQLLGRGSEEGNENGLGLIPFDNLHFEMQDYKVPHMGWDKVVIKDFQNGLTASLDKEQRFYFVHSYYAKCDKEDNIMMTCEYGIEFAAAVIKENVMGVQFHPEKSHKYGMRLLSNFVRICENVY